MIKILQKHRRRKERTDRSEEVKAEENRKAKAGMKLLREIGPLKEFERRGNQKETEMKDWETFCKRSETHKSMLELSKPDVVERINAKAREDKERERAAEESSRDWRFNGEEYEYVGEDYYEDTFHFTGLSPKTRKIVDEQEKKMYEAMWHLEKEKKQEEKRKKQEERKLAMQVPLPPVPMREKCAYELMRDQNIKERQEAMEKSNFFEELSKCKQDMTKKTVAKTVAPKKVGRKLRRTKRKILEGNKETDKPGSSKSDLKDNQIYFEVDDKKYTGSSKEDPVERGDDTEIYDYMFFFDAE